jgi:hypothetical protein
MSNNVSKFTKGQDLNIIFDFSCGRFYTHHSSYLKDYYDFFDSRDNYSEVWVNTSADQKVLDLFGTSVSAILRSNYYSHTRKDNFRLFLIDYVMNFLMIAKVPKLIRTCLSSFYIYAAIKELKKSFKNYNRINLISPTLDGLGLRFVIKSLKLNSDKISHVSIRVTGAERRGIFGFDNSVEVLRNLCLKYPHKVNIGYEVKAYGVKMQESGLPEKNLFWAPMPFIQREIKAKSRKVRGQPLIKLGFLGSARPNKGFDSIPMLLDSLRNLQIDFQAYVQLPEFEWAVSNNTYNKLIKDYAESIRFIEGGISKDILDETISIVDLIVLPYKLENYQLAGSGILFLAADFKIPIAATENLAFSWDIEQFNLGFTFKNEIDFGLKLKLFFESRPELNIEKYNSARTESNLKFLRMT